MYKNLKKIFRKNQIIITTLALMIAVAGYISYTKTNVAENEAIQTAGDNVDNTYDISEDGQIGEIFTDTEDNTDRQHNGCADRRWNRPDRSEYAK